MIETTKKRKSPTPIKWLKKEIKGFDESHLESFKKRNPNIKIEQRIRVEFGKISSYNRHYTNSEEKIKGLTKQLNRLTKEINRQTELKNKYEKLIKGEEQRYMKMIQYVNPKITLCRPTKSYPYWRGKVWWGVSVFGKKSGWKKFHIVSDKIVQRDNLSEEQIRQMGKDKFVDDMVSKDLILK